MWWVFSRSLGFWSLQVLKYIDGSTSFHTFLLTRQQSLLVLNLLILSIAQEFLPAILWSNERFSLWYYEGNNAHSKSSHQSKISPLKRAAIARRLCFKIAWKTWRQSWSQKVVPTASLQHFVNRTGLNLNKSAWLLSAALSIVKNNSHFPSSI